MPKGIYDRPFVVMEQKEVAAILGITQGRVAQLEKAALKKLAKKLAHYGEKQ